MEELSPLAQMCLEYFYQHPEVRVNYLALVERGISRRKSRAVLAELKQFNFVVAKRSRYIGTHLELTSTVPSKLLERTSMVPPVSTVTAVQLVSSISNSYTARTTDIATNKFLDGIEEEGTEVGYDFFESTSSGDDDLIRDREKHMAQKKAEYVAAREKTQARRDLHRSNIDPAHWTCKDVAYEFADRMSNIWSIKPFSVAQSRFVQALSVFRKQYDTNGSLELLMIDMFFASLSAEKYTDGNHLWRAFLYKAPQMLESARERNVSAETREADLVRDAELTAKKISLFEDDNV